jgi:hypothetical protein
LVRIVFVYGLISGLVVILSTLATIAATGGGTVWLGYLVMLVALSSILIAVKQHRDGALGGVIKFRVALAMGLAIALVASVVYVLVWEVYDAATHRAYMDHYTAALLAEKQKAGVTGAAYARVVEEVQAMRRNYANPLFRLPMIFLEIFPVGLLIAVVSAALVRNPKFLPARSRVAQAVTE